MKTFFALSLLLFNAMNAQAQDDFFSEVEVDIADEAASIKEKNYAFSGYFRQSVEYGLSTPDQDFPFARDERGLSNIQSEVYGEYGKSLTEQTKVKLAGKFEVNSLEWDAGEQEYQLNREKFFLKDAYVDYTPSQSLWLRAGHQVFAWGESEGLAVIDVLSPRDLREPGQAELRDIREPVPAVMLVNTFETMTLSAVFTYEAGQNRYADRNQEFYPYIEQTDSIEAFETLDPKKQWEFALRMDYQFAGGDIALIAAELNDNDPAPIDFRASDSGVRVLQQQERQRVLGVSLNKVWGSWLLKSELADYSIDENALFSRDEDQQRGMLGIEYSGVSDLLLSLEFNVTHFSQAVLTNFFSTEQESVFYGGAARLRHSALNARWINQVWLLSLAEEGEIARWESSWDWSDSLGFGFALTLYDSDKAEDLFFPFRKNDSAEIYTRWNF